MYDYIDVKLEELKVYINENLCWILRSILTRKISHAQKQLHKAYSLIEEGKILCGRFHQTIAKVYLILTDISTKVFNRLNLISDEDTEYILNSIHDIRNDVVILMGLTIGTEQAYNIALIEVDLLNLNDFIQEEICWWNRWGLISYIKSATRMLEMAIFSIYVDRDIDTLLTCAQYKLNKAKCKVYRLLNKGRISPELADILVFKITQAQESIEAIKNSL